MELLHRAYRRWGVGVGGALETRTGSLPVLHLNVSVIITGNIYLSCEQEDLYTYKS